ncbi:MAG: biotin--[acetyl-CoA-carboxylase] ligase, partial [Flavobacteriaceae bacterium]
ENVAELKDSYESVLYRVDMTSSFAFPDGTISNGIIRGISEEGKLIVELEEAKSAFDLKEIRLLN